jgi:hypothetical protein
MGVLLPYIIRIETYEATHKVVAEVATPFIAMSVLRHAVAEYPAARVTLAIDGHAAIVADPTEPPPPSDLTAS